MVTIILRDLKRRDMTEGPAHYCHRSLTYALNIISPGMTKFGTVTNTCWAGACL